MRDGFHRGLQTERLAKNICPSTREECEEKLAALTMQMKSEITEEKTKRQAVGFPMLYHTVATFAVIRASRFRTGAFFYIGTRHLLFRPFSLL